MGQIKVCLHLLFLTFTTLIKCVIFIAIRITRENGSVTHSVRYLHCHNWHNAKVSLRLRVQNAVSAQPCVGKLGISLVLLNFLDCNL